MLTDEERIRNKTRCMLDKEWCCNVCGGHNYTLAGKHSHIKTMKHKYNTIRNVIENNIREKLGYVE